MADVNGDNHLDLVAANEGQGTVSVMLGNGDGTFRARTPYGSNSLGTSVVIEDVNVDGNPDLVVGRAGTYSEDMGIMLGRGDGIFSTRVTYPIQSISVASGDLDKNGRPDLVGVGSFDGTITVLLNTCL